LATPFERGHKNGFDSHQEAGLMAKTTHSRQDMPRAGEGASSDEAVEHSEGVIARTIEQQTAKLPSDVFLWAAAGSIGVSLALQLKGRQHEALFVGQWAAPFLLLGVYNKMVKLAGSDRVSP
jgi:hypothetical protein